MTFAALFLMALAFACLVFVLYGVARLGYVAGFEEGRRAGHDRAVTMIYQARTELEPYVPEHFDERGRRSFH